MTLWATCHLECRRIRQRDRLGQELQSKPDRPNRFLASLRNDSVGNLSPRMPTKATERSVKPITTNEQNDLSPGIVISNGLRWQDGEIALAYTVPLRLNRFLASLRNDIVGNLSPRMPTKAAEKSVRPGITIHTRPTEPISHPMNRDSK